MGDDAFRERLRRLRRDAPLESAPKPERLPAWFRERAARDGAGPEPAPEPADVPGTLGDPERLEPERGEHGETVARNEEFQAGHRHGGWPLAEVAHAERSDFALLTGDGALGRLELAHAVYLDTETTGLSGGAGTTVFLVGLGSFDQDPARGGRFVLWQGFLREPAEERALLELVAARIRASSGVVSFFGKSFDRHRLEDKMRVHGVEPPFDAVPHLDLYHPLRRLYLGAYEDTKLKTLEHELCGVERTDDLSGAHAPAAWFDYLAGRPHRLEDVFRHNRDDVLSLVTLASHLGRTRAGERADGSPLAGDAGARVLGLARTWVTGGRREEAIALLRGLAERTREHEVLLADALRLARRPDEALEAYRALVVDPPDRHVVHALAQMAKLLEHHTKDRAAALECCRVARSLIAACTPPVAAGLVRELAGREARLEGSGRADREGPLHGPRSDGV